MSDKPLKIILTSPLAPDGVRGTYYSRMLASELEKLGHRVVYMKFGLSLPTGVRHLWFFLCLLRYGLSADVMITFDTYGVAWSTVWAGILTGTKTVMRVGGDYLWETYINRTDDPVLYSEFYKRDDLPFTARERVIRLFTKFIYWRVTAVIFSTRWQREIMRSSPYHILDSKVYYIDNFIGERQFQTTRPRMSSSYGRVYLLVGRPHKTKNLDRVRKAFQRAQEQVPEIKLETYSNIPQAEVLEHMKNCYVYISPAISEFSPNLALEALFYGKPVILTQESGYTDMLRDHTTLFNPLSTDELTDAIVKLSDLSEYQEAEKRARSFTRTHSYTQIAQEFIDLYHKL